MYNFSDRLHCLGISDPILAQVSRTFDSVTCKKCYSELILPVQRARGTGTISKEQYIAKFKNIPLCTHLEGVNGCVKAFMYDYEKNENNANDPDIEFNSSVREMFHSYGDLCQSRRTAKN